MGIILAVIGIIIVNLSSVESSEFSFHLLGNVLIIGYALFEALFIVLSKYNSERLSAYQISFIISFIALILFLPLSVYEALRVDYSVFDLKLISALAYYVIFVAIIPYILYYNSIRHISATSAGVLSGLQPIAGVFLSVVILAENISLVFITGAFITLIGIYITVINKERIK